MANEHTAGRPGRDRPRVVAEIEARMASSRLARKIIADIEGRTMLGRVLDAARRCELVDGIIVATTTNPLDDETQAWCEGEEVACFRGSEDDVLGRVLGAVERQKADVVVEMTGDNPLSCPDVIDAQIALFLDDGYDYLGDNIESTHPVGCGAKIFRAQMLKDLAAWCDDPFVREHVSLYFYEHPERYRIGTLTAPPSLRWPELRVTVDTPQDLEFARSVFRALDREGVRISYENLVRVVRARRLNEVNQGVQQKPARYDKSAEMVGT
jgi:spore coat polysaccharide biosynthesis protein SpsF